jgi:hypothetical protein
VSFMHSRDAAGLTSGSRVKRPAAKGHVANHHVANRHVAKSQAAIARRRAASTLGAEASAVPPLQWWRMLPADAFTAEHLGVLRRAVSGIGMVGEPRWADAVHGHPAAAVAVALRVMQERRPLLPIVDLTMSTILIAVLVTADPTAIDMMVTMISRMGADAEKEELRRSWLNRQRRRVHDRIMAYGMPAHVMISGA